MIKLPLFLIIATIFFTQMSMGAAYLGRLCGSAPSGISASVRGVASTLTKNQGDSYNLSTEGTITCSLDGYHIKNWRCYLNSGVFVTYANSGTWKLSYGGTCTAQWEKNTTANIKLYSENSLVQTKQCTIDGTIGTLPIPKKPGYKFTGWKTCATIISEINTSSNGTMGGGYNWVIQNNETKCFKWCPGCGDPKYYSCTETPNIGPGEWQAEFSYGTLYGESTCNTTPPATDPWNGREYIKYDGNIKQSTIFTMNTKVPSGDEKYCWCRITSFAPKNSASCRVFSSKWVYRAQHASSDSCAKSCAAACGGNFYDRPGLRSTMVGAVK